MSSGLNPNHRRSLVAGFRHLDELLADAESSANTSPSPFAKQFNDLSPVERRVVLDSVAGIRDRMVSAVRAIGVALPPPRTAASWAIQTALSFAQITVQEMDPKRLAGYGDVGPEAADLLRVLNADVERSLRRLTSYLGRGTGKDLAGRLDRLDAASVDISTVKTLGEVITAHGLVEYQGAFEALVERLESTSFEIAVFGKVSSGKSSLLNSIVEFAALPVGVTPVTAVPTRLSWGEAPVAEIAFAESPAETVPLERLAEFVSEDLNPENRKHVRRATVRIPVEFLRNGIVFVDTPGIGSLATSGARESYAYLPRCDLGILLIDAGSAPGRDEIDLLRLLYESGIPPKVAISKADLLSESDRVRMKKYVEVEITARLGTSVPVALVSTVGAGVSLARSWFEREIEPLISQSMDLARASGRRKLASLTEAIVAALRAEVGGADAGVARVGPAMSDRVEAVALRAESVIADASTSLRRIADRCRALADPTIHSASAEIARVGALKDTEVQRSVMKRAVSDTAAEVRSAASTVLVTARDRLRDFAREMAEAVGRTRPDVAEIAVDLLSFPTMVVPAEVDELDAKPPAWSLRPNPRSIARRIAADLEVPLTSAYASFGNGLLRTGERALSALAERFAAHSEPFRAQARRGGEAAAGRERSSVEEDLRRLGWAPSADPAAERASGDPERVIGTV